MDIMTRHIAYGDLHPSMCVITAKDVEVVVRMWEEGWRHFNRLGAVIRDLMLAGF